MLGFTAERREEVEMGKPKQSTKKPRSPPAKVLTCRFGLETIAQLNRLARQRRVKRSKLIQQFVEHGIGPEADNPQLTVTIRAINALNVCVADVAAGQRDMPIADIAASAERIENLLRALTKIIYITLYNTDTLTSLVAQEGTPNHTRIQRDNIRLAEESVPLLIQKALLMGSPTE